MTAGRSDGSTTTPRGTGWRSCRERSTAERLLRLLPRHDQERARSSPRRSSTPPVTSASASVAKAGGAWRWIGTVKTPLEVGLGGAALVVVLALYFLYYRQAPAGRAERPARWWQTPVVCGRVRRAADPAVHAAVPARGERRPPVAVAVRVRLRLDLVPDRHVVLHAAAGDRLGFTVHRVPACSPCCSAGSGARSCCARPGFGDARRAGGTGTAGAPPGTPYPVGGYPPSGRLRAARGRCTLGTVADARRPGRTPAQPVATGRCAERDAGAGPTSRGTSAQPAAERFRVTRAGRLPDFAAVGVAWTSLKEELGDTFGRLLAFTDEADAYRIRFNGHAAARPRGCRQDLRRPKATAGEFGLNFQQVSTSDLVSRSTSANPLRTSRPCSPPPPATSRAWCSSTSSTPSPNGATRASARRASGSSTSCCRASRSGASCGSW